MAALERVVVRRSPLVQLDVLGREASQADLAQAKLLGNPAIDAGIGTIPLGQTNPPGLESPLLNVPNYSLGVSYQFLLGKRGPRQRRAEAAVQGATAQIEATARGQAIELSRVLGQLATARLRVEALKGLVDEGKGTVQLAKSRESAGFGAGLEVDRLEIELSRIEQQVLSAEGDIRAALSSCAGLVGQPCEQFDDGAAARAFMQAWMARALEASGAVEQRPDIKVIDAQRRTAEAEGELARAQAIPDITVRLGYMYDTFVISGNQRHSVNLTVALPLPVFDRGQAQERGAEARRAALEVLRARVIETTKVRAASLRRALELQQKRREAITGQMLPRARAVLADLERAAANRLIPFSDVIPARRVVSELQIEEADSVGDAFQTSVELLSLVPEQKAGEVKP